MLRTELEHLIRAAAAVTNEYEIMIIGSLPIQADKITRLQAWVSARSNRAQAAD